MNRKKVLRDWIRKQPFPDTLQSTLEKNRLADNRSNAYLLSFLLTLVGLFLTAGELLSPGSPPGFSIWPTVTSLYLTLTSISAVIALTAKVLLPGLPASSQKVIIFFYGLLLLGGTTILALHALQDGNDLSDFLLGLLLIAVIFRFSALPETVLMGTSSLAMILAPRILPDLNAPSLLLLIVFVGVSYWIGHNLEDQRIENLLLNEKLRERNNELREISSTDALTGISNRRAFFARMDFLIEQSKRYGSQLSLIIMDIDKFKRVNDTLGHAAGDEVLRTFAALMEEATRSSDLFARYGGEEFILAMPHTGLQAAVSTAERLRAEIETTPFPGLSWGLTTSLGVADFDPGEESLEDTLIRADRALYRAKDQGGNRVSAERTGPIER